MKFLIYQNFPKVITSYKTTVKYIAFGVVGYKNSEVEAKEFCSKGQTFTNEHSDSMNDGETVPEFFYNVVNEI